jgi:hypothetical protein
MTLNSFRINYRFVTYSGKIFSTFGGPKLPQNVDRLAVTSFLQLWLYIFVLQYSL